MSFAGNVKEELLQIPIKNACCRRALVCGMLFCAEIRESDCGQTEGGKGEEKLILYLTEESAATLCCALIRQQFGREPECKLLIRAGKPSHKIVFSSRAAAAVVRGYADPATGALAEAVGFRCQSCQVCFLRGVFCASGSLSDPTRYYHLEFHAPDTERAYALSALLSNAGFEPGMVTRKNGCGLYYKSGTAVEDVLTYIGCQNALFEMMNCQIMRDLRNDVNRSTNCVATNIKRTVSAAQRQAQAIAELEQAGVLEELPDELRDSAYLRMEYPEMPLSELAMMHVPPITKSGLNHRLLRLLRIAESERLKNGKE